MFAKEEFEELSCILLQEKVHINDASFLQAQDPYILTTSYFSNKKDFLLYPYIPLFRHFSVTLLASSIDSTFSSMKNVRFFPQIKQ